MDNYDIKELKNKNTWEYKSAYTTCAIRNKSW